MQAEDGWHAYARQSYRMQFADGVRPRVSRRRSRAELERRRPGEVTVWWPGWQAASVRSWW